LEDPTRPVDEGWLQTEIAARALVVDRNGSRAFVFGKTFNTAPLSFRLLVALAERGSSAGAFLSREDAADRLWSGEFRSLSAFDSIVHKLRQDLVIAVRRERSDRTFVLETRRQRGYRLTLGPDDVLVI
jgi:DNA-binding winged helix-turn-helix (wHTH) protein